MQTTEGLKGVFSPVVTPFDKNLGVDAERLVRHCQWLVSQGVGLAIFGTNSEANSLSVSEKKALFDALVSAGIEPSLMMPGTGCCALPDTVELTRYVTENGAPGVLMLPPFYYKGVSDDGLFASYAEVIERVGSDRLKIYLYHIPQVSNTPISLDLINRLLAAYPGVIAGVKDSSGDWENTQAMIERFGPQGFQVFAGSESFLLGTLRAGGVGCITATGNVNPGPIVRLYETWTDESADDQQSALNDIRNSFQQYPMIPALKGAIAHFAEDPVWSHVRPPLVSLTPDQQNGLIRTLKQHGFSMPGLLTITQ